MYGGSSTIAKRSLAATLTLTLTLGSDWLHAGAWESSPQHSSWPDYPVVVKNLQDCLAANIPANRRIEVPPSVNFTKYETFQELKTKQVNRSILILCTHPHPRPNPTVVTQP